LTAARLLERLDLAKEDKPLETAASKLVGSLTAPPEKYVIYQKNINFKQRGS